MTGETKNFTPPYPPFKTFTNFLEGLEAKQEQFPPKIDRSYLRLDGATQSQLLAALRTFELIDEDGHVLPALKKLATRPDDRPRLVGDLVRRHYSEMIALGEQNATQQMLDDAFAGHGVTGSTRRKAISFFLKAAEWGGIELSPHFSAPRSTASAGSRRRRAAKTPPATPTPPPPAPHDAFEDLRTKYVEALLEKFAAANGEVDAELANRIERLVGFEQPTSSSKENQD